jgi:hypothetical protein
VIRRFESLAVASRPLQRRFTQISYRFCLSDILILNLRNLRLHFFCE